MREEQLQQVQVEPPDELEAQVQEQPRQHPRMLQVQQQERARREQGRQRASHVMHSIQLQPCGERVMFCFGSRECWGVLEPGCGRSAARWNSVSVKISPRREPRPATRDVGVQRLAEKVHLERVLLAAALGREIQAQVPRRAVGHR